MRGLTALAVLACATAPMPDAAIEVMPSRPDRRRLPPPRLNGGEGETSAYDLVRLARKNARRRRR